MSFQALVVTPQTGDGKRGEVQRSNYPELTIIITCKVSLTVTVAHSNNSPTRYKTLIVPETQQTLIS